MDKIYTINISLGGQNMVPGELLQKNYSSPSI